MLTSNRVQWGGLAAILAGVFWVVSGVISLAIPGQGTEDPGSFVYALVETLFCLALLGMIGGLVGLHTRQAPRYGWLGTIGVVMAAIGLILMLVSTLATLLLGREVLNVVFVPGMVGALVGVALVGIATLQAHVLPRWYGVLLLASIIGFPMYFIMGDVGGGIVQGLIWLALGYGLWTASRPDRVAHPTS